MTVSSCKSSMMIFSVPLPETRQDTTRPCSELPVQISDLTPDVESFPPALLQFQFPDSRADISASAAAVR